MKRQIDDGYGANNGFWMNLLTNCSEEEGKIIRAKLKKETPRVYKEFLELEKLK